MTIKVKEIKELICDVCGKEVDTFSRCGEHRQEHYNLTKDRYYAGTIKLDTCPVCQNAIRDLIKRLGDEANN